MNRKLAVGLLVVIFAGLGVAWSPQRWAVAIPQVGVLATLALWAFAYIANRTRPSWEFGLILPAGLACCGVLQLAFGVTVYRWVTVEAVLYWLTNAAVFFVAAAICRDAQSARLLLTWLFGLGAALALLSATQGFTSAGYAFWIFETPYREDVWGPFVYKNQYAAFLEILLPVAYVGAFAGRSIRWPFVLLTAGLYASIVAACSRMGLILATAELVIVPVVLVLRREIPVARVRAAIAPVLLLVVVFAAIVGPEKVWTRLQEQNPYAVRRDLTTASTVMFRSRPMTGFGLGTWPTVYPGYAQVDIGLFANQAHNDWAQAGVEAGVTGLLLMVIFFAWSAKAAWQRPWTIGIVIVLIHATVDYPIQRQALSVFYFAFAGLAAAPRVARVGSR